MSSKMSSEKCHPLRLNPYVLRVKWYNYNAYVTDLIIFV